MPFAFLPVCIGGDVDGAVHPEYDAGKGAGDEGAVPVAEAPGAFRFDRDEDDGKACSSGQDDGARPVRRAMRG